MGYRTRFTISVDPKEREPEVGTRLVVVSGYGTELSHINHGEEVKWYDCDEHCEQVSREFPDVTIRVQGIGEEQGDVWVSFWRDGKVQHHRAAAFVGPETPTSAPFVSK